MVEANFPEDVLVEILCRLPKKSLARFKCVSKQWLILISNRSRVFSRTISHAGIVCQSYLPVKFRRKASKPIIQPSRMSFLGVDNKGSASCLNPPHPTNIDEENYFLVSSCDGFLLLRKDSTSKDPTSKDPVKKDCFDALVFHPPTERLWKISRSTPSHGMHVGLVSDGHHFKLALFSSEMRGWASGPWFKLDVYSSENGIWREEKCHSPSITIPQSGNRNMDSAKSVFLSGAFHWIWGNYLVIYHLGKRDCKLLKLPPFPPFPKNGGRRKRQHQCIWESEGYVNYCQVSAAKGNAIGIWSLHKGDQNDEQNEHSCKWKSKHWDFLARSKEEFEHPQSFSPLAFNDDFEIVYLMCGRRLFSYNLATTEMKEACTSPFEGTDDRASCIALPFLYTQLDIGVTAIDDRELCKRRKKLF